MSSPLISIIIVNFNGRKYLNSCLDSLKTQNYTNFEVILVDNGSIDGSVLFAREKINLFRDVKVIQNKSNLGFSEGNNIGILNSRGIYIATLNNDTVVDKEWLLELVKVAEKDSDIGMLASKIILTRKDNLIDSVGVNIYPDGMSKQRGHLELDVGQYDRVDEVLLPSACAALYRRKMLDEIGLFDEDFFAYCEDTDLGLRGRIAGWKAVFVPTAIVYHHYSGTGGRHSPLKAYLVERNHFWVAIKNFPLSYIISLPKYLASRYLFQIYALSRKVGKASNLVRDFSKSHLLIILLKSWISALLKLPHMLKKRRLVFKHTKLSGQQLRILLRRYRLRLVDLILKE